MPWPHHLKDGTSLSWDWTTMLANPARQLTHEQHLARDQRWRDHLDALDIVWREPAFSPQRYDPLDATMSGPTRRERFVAQFSLIPPIAAKAAENRIQIDVEVPSMLHILTRYPSAQRADTAG